MTMFRKSWTPEEDAYLRANLRMPTKEVAAALGRAVYATEARVKRVGAHGGTFANRKHAPMAPASKVPDRACLKCGKVFSRTYKFHFMCAGCRTSNGVDTHAICSGSSRRARHA